MSRGRCKHPAEQLPKRNSKSRQAQLAKIRARALEKRARELERRAADLRRQAKFQRKALKKLRHARLYTGAADLRRKPSKYQKTVITKFMDYLTGSAKVVKPKNAKRYKKQFRVVGNKVLVPKRKGERVRVNRKGEIVKSRYLFGRRQVSKYVESKTVPAGRRPGIQYALPFNRGKKGIYWQFFPDREAIEKFFRPESTYVDWPDYVLEVSTETDWKPGKYPSLTRRLKRKESKFSKATIKKHRRNQKRAAFMRRQARGDFE